MHGILDRLGDFNFFRLVRFVLKVYSQKQVGGHGQDEIVATHAQMSDWIGWLELNALFTEERLQGGQRTQTSLSVNEYRGKSEK